MRGLAFAALLVVALSSGCGAQAVEDAPSLNEIAAATRADPYRFEHSLRAEGLNESVSSAATGAADPVTRSGVVRYVFDEGGDELTHEVRQIGDVTYTRFSGPDLNVGWTKEPTVDAEDVLGPFGAFSEPHRAADALARHGRDVITGPGEPIDGVPTTHYRATISTVELLGMGLTGAAREELEKDVRETGSETATVEAWAGADGVLRRLDFTAPITEDGESGRIVSSTRFFDFGKPVEIKTPPASEIEQLPTELEAEAPGPCDGPATPHRPEAVLEALRGAGFELGTSCSGGVTMILATHPSRGGDETVICLIGDGVKPGKEVGFDDPVVEGNITCETSDESRSLVVSLLRGL